ncbi:MAG: oxidoreductase [Rhizobiaceae bacterium MnEN-MB40S]|nr:MAG: oxidoreductase [Rhizobiaceae bacterium MnEN-MB40S]
MNVIKITSTIAACLLTAIFASAGQTADLPSPEGDVILTVSGEVGATNHDDAAVFDLEMLKAMPETSFKTSTIWTEGENEFRGVRLSDLLEVVDAQGSELHAIALNDYAVDIPTADAIPDGPIIAYQMNGKEMSVRDKGPLWIVFPYDQDAKFRTELVYSQSIWQLDRIEVRK